MKSTINNFKENLKKMPRSVLVLLILANLIAIPSLFHYIFYTSWIGLIGWGTGLFLMVIAARLRKRELEEGMKRMTKTQKKMNKYLGYFLCFALTMGIIASFYFLYKGNVKSFVFLFETDGLLLLELSLNFIENEIKGAFKEK